MADAMPATRVAKKLGPQQAGALKWARRYSDALVCVRYRFSADGKRRCTTVELLVDEAATVATRDEVIVGVRVDISEVALRERVKAAGGRWDAASKLWRLPWRQAKAMRLAERVGEK